MGLIFVLSFLCSLYREADSSAVAKTSLPSYHVAHYLVTDDPNSAVYVVAHYRCQEIDSDAVTCTELNRFTYFLTDSIWRDHSLQKELTSFDSGTMLGSHCNGFIFAHGAWTPAVRASNRVEHDTTYFVCGPDFLDIGVFAYSTDCPPPTGDPNLPHAWEFHWEHWPITEGIDGSYFIANNCSATEFLGTGMDTVGNKVSPVVIIKRREEQRAIFPDNKTILESVLHYYLQGQLIVKYETRINGWSDRTKTIIRTEHTTGELLSLSRAGD